MFAGVNHQSHIVELVDWVLQAFVYQELELCTKIPKRNIAPRNLAPNPALGPERKSTVPLGRDQHQGGYIYLIPNSCILSSAKRKQDIPLLLVEESKR